MQMGIWGLLTVIFVTLKLIGVIAWSWWWVLSPLWIGALILIGVFFVFGGIGVVLALIPSIRRRGY